MTGSSDYDPFARTYDVHWGSYATQVYPILEHLALRHLPEQSTVLDLCCGTGQLAARLSADEYVVTGVDISESMVEIAKTNAPGASFHVQDARAGLPGENYDAVFSTYDSLNHLMTIEELTSVLGNVRSALAAGGRFVFDLNMAAAYEARWHGTFAYVEDDHVCLVRSSHDVAEQTGTMQLTIFELEGGEWQRADVRLVQRWYAEQDVREGLRCAGFTDIDSYSADEPIAEGCPTSAGRMFFVARR